MALATSAVRAEESATTIVGIGGSTVAGAGGVAVTAGSTGVSVVAAATGAGVTVALGFGGCSVSSELLLSGEAAATGRSFPS